MGDPPEGGASISKWLKTVHSIDLSGHNLNEHRRRHLGGGSPRKPPPAPASAPTAPPPAPAGPLAPPPNPAVAFIDGFLNRMAVTYETVAGNMERRVRAFNASSTTTVVEGEGQEGGRGAVQPAGPTKPEADLLPGLASGIAALLRERRALTSPVVDKNAPAKGEVETIEGLKQLLQGAAGAPLPRPPRIEGDAPLPAPGEPVDGYEPAEEEEMKFKGNGVEEVGGKLAAPSPAPIPPPPPSGPRAAPTPASPPPTPIRRAAGLADAFQDEP